MLLILVYFLFLLEDRLVIELDCFSLRGGSLCFRSITIPALRFLLVAAIGFYYINDAPPLTPDAHWALPIMIYSEWYAILGVGIYLFRRLETKQSIFGVQEFKELQVCAFRGVLMIFLM